MAKIVLLVIWLTCLINILMPFPGITAMVFNGLLVFLVVAHSIECAIFYKKVMAAEGNKALHFLQVFLFGIVHMASIKDNAVAD